MNAVGSRNRHFKNQASVALNPFFGSLVVRSARISADRQTDTQTHTHRPSTVTLAAHARRGLMTEYYGVVNGDRELMTEYYGVVNG